MKHYALKDAVETWPEDAGNFLVDTIQGEINFRLSCSDDCAYLSAAYAIDEFMYVQCFVIVLK